jgi:hypothetical protein
VQVCNALVYCIDEGCGESDPSISYFFDEIWCSSEEGDAWSAAVADEYTAETDDEADSFVSKKQKLF